MVASLEFQGHILKLTDQEVVIGREGSFFSVTDSAISRQHFKICHKEGTYYLYDLGSKNGTYLNDQKLGRDGAILPECAYIKCGNSLFTFINLAPVRLEMLTGPLTLECAQDISNLNIRKGIGPLSGLVYHISTVLQEKQWNDAGVQMEVLTLLTNYLEAADAVLIEASLKPPSCRALLSYRAPTKHEPSHNSPITIHAEMITECLQSRQALIFRNPSRMTLCVPLEIPPVDNILHLERSSTNPFSVNEIMTCAAVAKLIALHYKAQKLREQIERGQKLEMVGIVSGGIVHSFNNILGGLIGNLNLLKEEMMSSGDYQNFQDSLENMAEALLDAKSLTQDILSYARGIETSRAPLDLGKLLHNFYKIYRPTLPANVQFSLECLPTGYLIRGNYSQLAQVFLNLLQNAVQAMPQGGKLTLKLSFYEHHVPSAKNLKVPAGQYVEVMIQDTGSGMDQATIHRLFTPLFTTKPSPLGTGLGLCYVLSVIEKHHGDIQVESKVGQGTTFWLYLPLESSKSEAVISTTSLPLRNWNPDM